MKIKKIKISQKGFKYSIMIGNGIINSTRSQIRKACPEVKKICLVADKNIPVGLRGKLKKQLTNYELHEVILNMKS